MSESVTLSSHLDLSSKVVAVLVHFRATTPKQKAHGDAVVSVSVTSTPKRWVRGAAMLGIARAMAPSETFNRWRRALQTEDLPQLLQTRET